MKFYCKLNLLMLLLVIFSACSRDDEAGNVDPDSEEQTLVNKITLEVERVETPPTPENPGNYSVWFTMVGNSIYYINPSNTGIPQFMLKYSVNGNYFQSVLPHEEVCACGYSSKLVGNENRLFYIANEAFRYNIGQNNWTELNYPEEYSDNNGETGIVYHGDKVYFLGERDSSTRFKYYNSTNDSWGDAEAYTYPVDSPDLISIGNKIYALGGDVDKKKFGVFDEASGWTQLPDLDFQAGNFYSQHTIAGFQNRFLFIMNELQDSSVKIHVYDTQENEWKENPINVELEGTNNYYNMNLFSNNSYLYLVSTDNDYEMNLHKITIGFDE